MDLPTDEIHDITHSYGRLVIPVWWNRKRGLRWLMFSTDHARLCVTTAFHNCSATGVR